MVTRCESSSELLPYFSYIVCNFCIGNKYRLHREVKVIMGFTQPRAEGPRIV